MTYLQIFKDAKLKFFRRFGSAKYSFLLVMFAASVVHAAELPANVVKLIPNGFEVLSYAVGQLTDNNHQDYLVVVHHPVDTMQEASVRPLLIFTQNIDGT